MPPTPPRQPSLPQILLGFLPALAMLVLAWALPASARLVPLLLAGVLIAGALAWSHGIGGRRLPVLAQRGLAYALAYVAYVALVYVLAGWPLAQLAVRPSLGAALVFSTALAGALALLWRAWPLFGLAWIRDAAATDAPARRMLPWVVLARHLKLAAQLADEERFFSHYLPVAACMLASAIGALVLGVHADVLPAATRAAALWLYGLVLLPLCAFVVLQRTLGALVDELGPLPDEDEPTADAQDTPSLDAFVLSAADGTDAALLEAVRAGHADAALVQLELGADPNACPEPDERDKRSALILAALLPETRLLRGMIAHGADVNRMQAGLTPLLAATRDSYHGRAEAVMTLLANGADPCIADADGNTPLHGAALSAEPTVAAMLIDAEADPNAINRAGLTPLATACRAANWPLVKFLLEHGARPAQDNGEPAVLAAASIAEDDAEGLRMLLRHKASVHAANALGRNALMAAALESHADIARTLLEAGIDVDATDHNGTTALMEAARSGALGVIQVIADAGARPDIRDKHGRDALMLACQSPRTHGDIVRALLDMGADPRALGQDQRSALDHAAATGRWDLVALMDPETPLPANLDLGAGPEPGADTPDHLADALRFGHWAIASTFGQRVREWPQHDLAHIYLVLADAPASARRWLLDHGLSPHAVLDDGEALLDALLDALPVSAPALADLMAAGASCAGTGRIARALAAAPRDPACDALAVAMLAAGGDPFGPHQGQTPMHLAAAGGQLALLEELLRRGCNPNVADASGRTPLHAALDHPEPLPQIRALIRAGADPEAPAANNETPLGAVLDHADPEVTRWLRWGDSWPLPRRALQPHDLPAAAAAGDNEAVCKLLELDFAVDSSDAQGASALLRAAGMGHADTVRLVVEHGADLAHSARSGVTALAAAANAGRRDIVELLVDSGARIDQPLPGRTTAMMLAVARGHVDIVQQMLAAGADIHVRDMYGRGALHPAAQFSFAGRDSLRARRMLDLLLRHGAEANAADQDARTPLLLLLGAHAKPGTPCDGTHLGALVPVLLEAGADPRHADRRGVTALHACAMHMLVGAARVLLANGAARDAVDEHGRTPAELARELGYIDVAMELESRQGVPGASQTLRRPAAD